MLAAAASPRRDVFEANGAHGTAILEHPHFLAHLRYFLFGPDLPESTVKAFHDLAGEDPHFTRREAVALVRSEARRLARPGRPKLTEEFFRLALECGWDDGAALAIRDAARSSG